MANRQVARVLGHIWKVQLLEGRTEDKALMSIAELGLTNANYESIINILK